MTKRLHLLGLVALASFIASMAPRTASAIPADQGKQLQTELPGVSSDHDAFGDDDGAIDINDIIDINFKAPAKTENCVEELILAAAKRNVAARYGDRTFSVGKCAAGVYYSLAAADVGIPENSALGNAIDYINSLPPYGFVDSGLRDPNTAPAGSIIVFSGPLSSQYLSGPNRGHYNQRGAGTWLGHVTIKGDDGRYYTDGRTTDPAVGWKGGRNAIRVRNVMRILVPGDALIKKYANFCGERA